MESQPTEPRPPKTHGASKVDPGVPLPKQPPRGASKTESNCNQAKEMLKKKDNNQDVPISSSSGTNNADQNSPSVPSSDTIIGSRGLDEGKKSVGSELAQTGYHGISSDSQNTVNSGQFDTLIKEHLPPPGAERTEASNESTNSGQFKHTANAPKQTSMTISEDSEDTTKHASVEDEETQDISPRSDEGSHIHAGARSQAKPIPPNGNPIFPGSGVSAGFDPQSNQQNQSEFNQIDYVAIITASITIIIVFSILSILWAKFVNSTEPKKLDESKISAIFPKYNEPMIRPIQIMKPSVESDDEECKDIILNFNETLNGNEPKKPEPPNPDNNNAGGMTMFLENAFDKQESIMNNIMGDIEMMV